MSSAEAPALRSRVLPSRRMLLLAALGLAPAALAVVSPAFFAVALLYLAVCGVLMAGNALLGIRPKDVEVVRLAPERLSLGERECVELRVRNYSRFPLRLTIQDTLPPTWDVEGLPGSLTLRSQEEATLTYHVISPARGRYELGDLHLRVEHAPGLAVRQWTLPAPAEVRTYPDLREVARYELMARRSRLGEFGIHRSRHIGRGTEFERIRDYTPDDEYRQIDWKATARRHRPMSRVYEVERSQNVLIVLDAGRMMAGRVGKLAKLDYAINAALMLAHVALRAGDRVGLMIVSDEVDAYLPLGKGEPQLRQCLELLYGVEARLCHVDYRGALEQIATRVKRRSLVVFFTDLVDEETSAELVTYLRLLLPTHLPLCVTLQDERVVAAARRPVESAAEMYARTVALDLLGERRRIQESLHKLGALVLDSAPEELSVSVVNRYLELKARQKL
ncbi:MAG: DUF58 domain-containing protein [Armatimonadota bacterium]